MLRGQVDMRPLTSCVRGLPPHRFRRVWARSKAHTQLYRLVYSDFPSATLGANAAALKSRPGSRCAIVASSGRVAATPASARTYRIVRRPLSPSGSGQGTSAGPRGPAGRGRRERGGARGGPSRDKKKQCAQSTICVTTTGRVQARSRVESADPRRELSARWHSQSAPPRRRACPV